MGVVVQQLAVESVVSALLAKERLIPPNLIPCQLQQHNRQTEVTISLHHMEAAEVFIRTIVTVDTVEKKTVKEAPAVVDGAAEVESPADSSFLKGDVDMVTAAPLAISSSK